MNATVQTGTCLCGACRFTATPEAHAHVCHCGNCRAWSGGMFISTDCGKSLTFEDDAPITVYESSAWGRRIFCKVCGSSLVWSSADGSMNMVSVQAFPDPAEFSIDMQIYIDRKPDSYDLANQTRTMTGAEVEAQFADSPEGNE